MSMDNVNMYIFCYNCDSLFKECTRVCQHITSENYTLIFYKEIATDIFLLLFTLCLTDVSDLVVFR